MSNFRTFIMPSNIENLNCFTEYIETIENLPYDDGRVEETFQLLKSVVGYLMIERKIRVSQSELLITLSRSLQAQMTRVNDLNRRIAKIESKLLEQESKALYFMCRRNN